MEIRTEHKKYPDFPVLRAMWEDVSQLPVWLCKCGRHICVVQSGIHTSYLHKSLYESQIPKNRSGC